MDMLSGALALGCPNLTKTDGLLSKKSLQYRLKNLESKPRMIMTWPFSNGQLAKGSKQMEHLGELCFILSLTSSRNLGCFCHATGTKSVQSLPSPHWVRLNSDAGD